MHSLFQFNRRNKNVMKLAKKYSTFEQLKSSDEKALDLKTSLKKHSEFEKFIMLLQSTHVHKKNTRKS